MAEFGRFGILPDGRRIRLGGHDIHADLRLLKWMVGGIYINVLRAARWAEIARSVVQLSMNIVQAAGFGGKIYKTTQLGEPDIPTF
jgi:hypothetical protein